MEDIKKAIEEEANRYTAFNIDSEYSHFKLLSVQAQDDVFDAVESAVTHGANFILSKWEESERWRKVEEELPEDNITVLLEIEYDGLIDYSAGHFYNKGKKSHIDCELYEDAIITRWKPIH